MFVFLTSASFALHEDKSYKYVFYKIKKFLINYWVAYSVIFLIAILCGYKPDVLKTILELCGIEYGEMPIMRFNWYASFYIVLMLILPLISKMLNSERVIKDIINSVISYVIIVILVVFFHKFDIFNILYNLIRYYIPIILGYLTIKYNLLNRIYCFFKSDLLKIILGISMINIVNIAIITFPECDCIFVIIFILGIALMQLFKIEVLNKMLRTLGRNSMNIWFIHTIFFNISSKNIFQPIAYFWKNPILIIIWVLVLCLIFSKILNKLQLLIINDK